MAQQEVEVLEEAGNDRSLWRAAALHMVTVKTPQHLSTTTEMPASERDWQTLHSNRLVPELLLQPHLQPRFLHRDLLTLTSSSSNQSVSLVNILHSSEWPSHLTQLFSVRPPDCSFIIAYVYFIHLFLVSKLSSSLRGRLSWIVQCCPIEI